jgi:uncharacterized protein YndB with AHSA1/START domain
MTEPIVVVRRIEAPPPVVYSYLTDSDRWAAWQGAAATIEAAPGGQFSMRMGNGMEALGRFVELVPGRRVVFTWGWAGHPAVPPGSSTVEIDLVAEGGGTVLRLTHRGLPDDEVATHTAGWHHYLPRLAAAAAGAFPGPDPGP